MVNKSNKIIFWGTSFFAVPVLESLIKSLYIPTLIITQPDKPTKRSKIPCPPPIKEFLQKTSSIIPILQPENIKETKIIDIIKKLKPELGITASYGQIIPKKILDLFPLGCLNIHASLLPKYRGSSPIASAILNNEKETGITIMLMDEHMDTGHIITQKKLEIKNTDTKETLEKNLSIMGGFLLIKTLPTWLSHEIKPIPQDNTEATYTKLLTKEDGLINWTKPADYIERQIRAFFPWPNSWSIWQEKNKKIYIHQTSLLKMENQFNQLKPGTIKLLPTKQVVISSGKNYLVIEKIQLEGKKILDINDFIRGQKDFIGGTLI